MTNDLWLVTLSGEKCVLMRLILCTKALCILVLSVSLALIVFRSGIGPLGIATKYPGAVSASTIRARKVLFPFFGAVSPWR